MGKTAMYMVIGIFFILVMLQFYFRIRVIKVYKKLVQNKVQFDTSHIFSKKKMESEVLTRYPEHKEDILKFVHEMRFSLQVASVLIILIFIAGYILRS
jgi:hypothetical protein